MLHRGGGEHLPEEEPWWFLYLMGLLLVGLAVLIEATVPGDGLRSVLELAVVVLMFGLMATWVRRNRVAIELEEARARRQGSDR
ncbi:MAG TPA: hypothetical protein VKG64_05730 [Methylomirabilota bacterium]|nr:hypothetical protein [Methylomirabilota bacterium]